MLVADSTCFGACDEEMGVAGREYDPSYASIFSGSMKIGMMRPLEKSSSA